MTDDIKKFIADMRKNANRTGNKAIESFLRDGATTVQELAQALDEAEASVKQLSSKLADAEERAANWKELATAKTPKPEATNPDDTNAKLKKRNRFDYTATLDRFYESDESVLRIKCERAYGNSPGYNDFYPSLKVFRNQIAERHLPMDVVWSKRDTSIVLIKCKEDHQN